MSHELTIRENGYVEHAYVGEVGWHGLGNELKPGAPIEEWKKAAGMDWRTERLPKAGCLRLNRAKRYAYRAAMPK